MRPWFARGWLCACPEIPGGAVAARGDVGGREAREAAIESEDDRNCLHTLPRSFTCRVVSVLGPPIAFVSPTFLRAYPSPDVSWAQEPRAAKTLVHATSVYPQRKPVRSRYPRDSCY